LGEQRATQDGFNHWEEILNQSVQGLSVFVDLKLKGLQHGLESTQTAYK
jgi:hypothetical protein